MNRYKNIDGLRAFCCLGIVAFHLWKTVEYDNGGIFEEIVQHWGLLVIPFMMLSGFGICAGYLDKFSREVNLEGFYLRRYAKILPFFAVTTVIGVVAEHSMRGIAEGIMELSLVFGLLPNNGNCFNVNGVCWTLGTIFAFYLLFPAVSVLLKNKTRAWLAFAAALVIQFLCETLFMTAVFVSDNYLKRSNVLYSMAFFLAGGLLYLYRLDIEKWVKAIENTKRRQYILLTISMVSSVLFYITPHELLGVSIVEQKVVFCFAFWCMYAIGASSFILNNRVVNRIAGNSMEIYLSHMITLKALRIFKITEIMEKNIVSFFCDADPVTRCNPGLYKGGILWHCNDYKNQNES